MRLSAYARKLREHKRSRFIAKVRQCERVDPLDFQENEVRRDNKLLPRVDLADIKDYHFTTREQLKAHKAMERHNYQQLIAGAVRQGPRWQLCNLCWEGVTLLFVPSCFKLCVSLSP